MFSKFDNGKIDVLKRTQTNLTQQINVLQNETRRLREEISSIEVTKTEVEHNKRGIETTIRDIERLQKNIKEELNRLSRKKIEIENATSNLSPSPEKQGDSESNIPTPPPPPLINKSPSLQKTTSFKTISTKVKSTENTELPLDVLNNIKKGVTLNKFDENNVQEYTTKEEIARYQSSIHKKEQEIKRLTELVGNLSTKLKTERESQYHYQIALETQNILLSQLNQKKQALEEKLNIVKERVGTELTELEKIEDKRKEEAKEKDTLSEMNGSKPVPPDGKDAPPPPPPPPPPVVIDKRLSPSPMKQELPEKTTSKQFEESSSSEGTNRLNTEEVKQKAKEFEARKEARAVRDYLTNALIDLVIEVARHDLDDIGIDNIEFKENDQKLVQLIKGSGVEELSESLTKIVRALNKNAYLTNAIQNRRAAIAGQALGFSKQIEQNRSKPEIQEAVTKFIDTKQEEGIQLLDTIKEIKQREEEAARILEEEKRIEQERLAKERSKQQEEENRIAEENKALATQRKLIEMGVQEGVVNLDKVREAESDTIQIIEAVSFKKSNIQHMDDFVSDIDTELEKIIHDLHEAEEHRASTLETIAKNNKVLQEAAEIKLKSNTNEHTAKVEEKNVVDLKNRLGEKTNQELKHDHALEYMDEDDELKGMLKETNPKKAVTRDELSNKEFFSKGLATLHQLIVKAYYDTKILSKQLPFLWEEQFKDVLLKNLFDPERILHAINREQLISIENSPVSNLTYQELNQSLHAIEEGDNNYYSLTVGDDITNVLLSNAGLSKDEILTFSPTTKLFYHMAIANALRVMMSNENDNIPIVFKQIYKKYLSKHIEQEKYAQQAIIVYFKDLLNQTAPIIQAHRRFVKADQLLQSSIQIYQSNSPLIQYVHKVREEVYKLALQVNNSYEIDTLADIEETCAKALLNPSVETIQACIDKGNALTKHSLTKSLGGIVLTLAGVAIFSLSIAVAVESFGIAAPLSALGMAFGESLIVGSLASSSAALGAGGSAYGSYMFFKNANKDPVSEELYGIANTLVEAS